jgi:hypothetical protein
MKEEETPEKVPSVREEKEEEEVPPAELIDNLPTEAKKLIGSFLSIERYSGPFPRQFFEKINEQHISKILEIAEKDEERSFEDVKSSRKYSFGYVLIFTSLLIFLTVFLVYKDIELYKEVFKLLIVYGGGLGSGFGINQWMRRRP